METKKEMAVKVKPLAAQKENKPGDNEIAPVQRIDGTMNPTEKEVGAAVVELNPDRNSMNSRG